MAKALNVSLSVTADTSQAKMALQQLQSTLTSLTTTPTNITIGGQLKKDVVEATQAIASLQSALKNATNTQTGNLDLTKFNYQMQQSGMKLQDYQAALSKMGPTGKQAFAQLASSISQAEVPLKRSNTLLTEFWTTLKNTARWQISSSLLHGFIGTIQTAYHYAQDLNESLNNIQIVTGLSDEKMAKFAESANKAAKSLSTTTTSYTDAALIYYQQGIRDDKEIASRVETTIKLANVSGQSAEKVSNQMTAIWNNFADGSHNLEYYADVITALGAATASSSEEIATGLSKFAAVADTVGLSYENASAALATITATTRQSADTVGTGLRTLFSRLQSLKLGDTLEDGVDLTKYTKALETVGVSALDANGNLRAMDNILEDLGARWQTLSDAQKTALAQTVGGVRQYTTLIALMDNFDFYKENQAVALGSEGTVQKQADIYAKSWEAASKRVKASAQSIYTDLLDDQFFIKLNNGFAGFLDSIHNIIQSMGGLKGILTTVGTLFLTVFADKTASKIQSIAYDLSMLTASGRQRIQNLRNEGNQMLIQAAGAQGGLTGDSLSTAYAAQGSLSEAYLANANAMSAAQKDIANSLIQQQAALVKNVELSAQDLQNTEEKANAQAFNARRMLNAQGTNANRTYADNALQIESLRKSANEVGKIEAIFNKGFSFNFKDSGELTAFTTKLQQLKIDLSNISSYGPEAQAAFNELNTAIANFQNGTGTLDQVNQALTKLETTLGSTAAPAEIFEQKVEAIINDLAATVPGFDASGDAAKRLRESLMGLANTESAAGEKAVVLAENTSGAAAQADAAAAAMQKLGQAVQSGFATFVAAAGAISSVAMAFTTLKNLVNTWKDPEISVGDKLLSTATQVGIATMMLSSAFTKISQSTALVNIGTKLIGSMASSAVPGISALGTALTGTASAGAAAAGVLMGLAAIIAIIVAALVLLGTTIAKAVVTPKEHMEALTECTESAKEAAEDAKNAYDDLMNGISGHNQLLEELNECEEGTIEFTQALLNANAAAQELIEKYGMIGSIDPNTGLITFSQEEQQRVQQEYANKVMESQQRSLAAQAVESSAKVSQDYEKITNELPSIYSDLWDFQLQQLQNQNDAVFDLLDSYGLTADQFKSMSAADFKKAMLANSGAAYKNRNLLSNIALENGPIDDLEALLIDSIAQDSSFWENVDNSATKYYRRSGNHKWINLDDENTTLKSLQEEYKATFGEDAYEEFVASDAYTNAEDKKARKKLFRDAIRAYNEAEIARQELEDRQQEIASSEIKKYKDYRSRNRSGMQEIENELQQHGGSLSDIEKQYLENMVNAYQNSASEFIGLASSLGISDNNGETGRLASAMKNMSIEDFEQLTGIGEKLQSAFGKEGANAVFDDLVSAFEQGNTRLMNAARSLDLSGNIIEDITKIRSSFQGLVSDDTLNSWINSLKESAGGEKGLFESLLGSESFSDSLEDLQKTFKKTGKIGAKAILEAADECDILSQYLEESEVNAQGLADALEAIEMGDIGVDQITDQLLEALSAAGELENHLANCFDYIDNFSQERSVRDIGSFYKGLAEDIQDSVEAGFYGDPQLIQAWGEFFGQSGVDAMLDAWTYATGDQNWSPDQVNDYMNQNLSSYYDALNKVIKWGDLSGMWGFYEKSNADLNALWDMRDNDQVKLNYSIDELKSMGLDSQDSFIKYLTDRGVSDTMAEMMTSEYVHSNGALYDMWQSTATKKGIEKLIGTKGNPTEQGVTTREELQAFYNQYGRYIEDENGERLFKGDGSEADFNKYLEYMKTQAKATGQAIVDLGKDFNYAEADLQKLTDTMANSGGATLDEYLTKVTGGKTKENWSFDDLEEAFTKLGYATQEAYKLIDQTIGGEGSEWVTNFKNQFVEATSEGEKQWDRFIDYMSQKGLTKDQILNGQFTSADWAAFLAEDEAEAQAQHTADIMAQAFAEALTGLTIEWDEESKTFKIKFAPDAESLAQVEEQIGEAAQAGANQGLNDGAASGDAGPTIESMVSDAVNNGVSELDPAISGMIESAVSDALAEANTQIESLNAEHQAELQQVQAEAEAAIAQAQADATAAIEQAKAEAQQIVDDTQATAAETLAATEQTLSAMRSEVETLQANAEAAAERAAQAEADADAKLIEAQNAKQLAEQARESAEAIARQAGEDSAQAKAAAERAASLESAAQAAQEAANTAVAAAAAERAAAEGAQAAAEAAASLAADVASQVISFTGQQVQEQYTGTNAAQIQGMNSEDVGLMAAYAQAGYTDFNAISWGRFRRSEVGQDMNAPSWWEMSSRVSGTDFIDGWDPQTEMDMLDALRETVGQIEEHTDDTATATDTLAEQTEGVEHDVVDSKGTGTTSTTANATTINNNTTTTSTTINQQVAQNTGASDATVALVSALKQAGVTADTYQQGETIDQIDWSGLEASVASALSSALADANNGETLTNEQFATISAEIDSLTVGAEVEPIEVPAEVTEVDDTALQNEDESKIETTAEVTEVDTSAIDEAAAEPIEAEATVNYVKGEQEEPEEKETKVHYRMGEQANPTPRWTSVNYSLGSQANPVDKTAKVNYVRGTQEAPADQTATASCFVAGTQVLLADYTSKNIEDIKIGDFVIAYNEQTQKFEPHKVTKTFIHPNNFNRTYKIYFNNGVILHLTPEHPLLSTKGWTALQGNEIINGKQQIQVKQLNIGDTILGFKNNLEIINIEFIKDNQLRTVYNLEVEICHTYLANGLIVHNRKTAMGYNNATFAKGYTGSNHLAGTYQGLATLGELGPELMIHGNEAYLVGMHGRVTTYVQPDDQIFTAAQTQKILDNNPLMRDIPGFSVGYNHDQTMDGSSHGSGSGGGSGSDKSSTKEIKETLWYPERYHLIERQIDDLTRAYEKLNKAKDRAYGANRLKAINDEIKAHKELMKAQQREIDEAQSWLEYDKDQLRQAGLWDEIELDANGNIANFDELQDKYSRAIKQGLGIVGEVDEATYDANEDAKEEAQKKWDLITHYEETLDKLKDLDDDYLDSLYELADMLQELATTKVEIRVNVDQKDLDLLEHYINKIDDNIWATGDVLSLVGGKLTNYADQINVYKNGMNDLLKNATNAQGQAVPGLTLEKWMAMTPEQRDALNLDSNLMEKIEEYEEEILKLLDNIEQLKTKGLEELAAAFDEVNTATQTSLAMFDNYSDTISRLKDMTEVQMAFKPTSDTNKLLDKMDRAAIRQNKDQLKARQAYTAELEKERAIIQELYDKEIDTDRKKLYQEQLDNFDSLILTEQQKIEDLWKNSADAIKNIYDRLIDDIKDAFDKAINARGYDSEDLYTEGKNTRQMQQDEVVDDYERLYRLTNLQRKVDKDIDDRLKANLKNNQRLIALQEEINNLKETGQEMSEYELELLEKKYEYELAMAELEDDAAAKSTVRLTRDRNGNWGYIFSAAPDENAEYEKQQAASDALYERQKLDQTRLNEVASQIDELGQRYSSEIQNLEQAVINGEITAAEAVAQRAQLQAEYQKQLATLMRDLNVAMEDSAITQPLMVERYGDQNATIRDSFNETSNAIVNEARTIQDYFTSTNEAFDDFLTHYQQAIDDYNEEMEQLNSDVSQGTEDFEYLAEQQLKALQKASAEQLQQVRDNIAEMQKVIGEGDETILAEVERFNRLYSQKFQPVIDTNERFLNQLQEILSLLNRIDYDVDNQNTITSQEKLIADQQAKLDQGRTASQKDSGQIAGYDEGGYTGMWGNWGKLAILHEGEQVFNKADTNKLLDAAKILRTLDLQADFFGKGLSFLSEMPKVNESSESSFQQEVHINANFPGVSSRAEIVAAFSDLENQAYQYANRKYTAIKNTA